MSTSNSATSPHERSPLYWGVVPVASVLGLVFGTWGYWLHAAVHHAEPPSVTTALYHAVQLFFFHMPHFEGSINLPLEVGRWSAGLATGLTGILLLHRILWIECRAIRLKLMRDHTIICGLGDSGSRIATTFKRCGMRVAAIERSPHTPGVAEAERAGIPVVIGDAAEARILRAAGAARAKTIMAVCAGDDTNLGIAGALQGLAKAGALSGPSPECVLLIEDATMRRNIQGYLKGRESASNGIKFRVGGFDIPEMLAREAFRLYPFDFQGIPEESRDRVHLVLLGTCPLAFAFAKKALQLCHYANQSRLRLTCLGADAPDFLHRLRSLHPHADPWYDAEAAAQGSDASPLPDTVLKAFHVCERVTVVVGSQPGTHGAGDLESKGTQLALAAASQLDQLAQNPGAAPSARQVLVRLGRNRGLGSLLASGSVAQDAGTRIWPFGSVEDLCCPDVLLEEKQDVMAKEFQAKFREQYGEAPWEELFEDLRDSNRQAADHIPAKLRALGMDALPTQQDEDMKPASFPADDSPDQPNPWIVPLARMEHNRWCAERYLAGWKYGTPANSEEKKRLRINRFLVPWEQVPEKDRNKDYDQIRAIPEVLKAARYGIYQHPLNGFPPGLRKSAPRA